MPKNLLDTNLIIRFLVGDDLKKSSDVEKLLKEDKNTNVLPSLIVGEIIWVLSSYYGLKKEEIIGKIRALLEVKSIKSNKSLLLNTLSVWEEYNISFIDAYLTACAQGKNLTLYTYDQRIKKINDLTTKEP